MISDLAHIVAQSDTPIIAVIEKIDKGAIQVALITDKNGKLLAAVTDGDIRRAILRDIDLQKPIASIMNVNPVTIQENALPSAAQIMRDHQINHLPVVDESGVLRGIELLNEKFKNKRQKSSVLIMAGGLGSRLRPLTAETPKPMLCIGGRPLLETVISNLKSQGFYKFFISVNFKKEVIQKFFGNGDRLGIDIKYLVEEHRLGTAGALSLIEEKLDEPLIVLNGDVITTMNYINLLDFHKETDANITVGVREHTIQIPFGVINANDTKLEVIEEKPIKTFKVNAGIYVIDPSVLQYIPKSTEYDMPNLINACVEKGIKTSIFPVREYWIDVGSFGDFQRAEAEYAQYFEG